MSTEPVFQAATPRRLFTSPLIPFSQFFFQYDVTRDGKRFVMIVPVEGAVPAPVTVVLNWEAALRK